MTATIRIVSLVPSITETLLDWGVRPVGVTRFCEAPGVATVGGTKNPDLDAIVGLAPDVVLLDQEENRLPDADELERRGVTVVATRVQHIDGVADALGQIARAVGIAAPPPPHLILGHGIPADAIPANGPQAAAGGPTWAVFVPIWRRPWMTIGTATYGSSLLERAGLVNIYRDDERPYPQMELGDARARRPDRVLAPSEPYPFGPRHLLELESVAPVVWVDGQDLFWWGSRTPAALGRLRQLAADLSER